MDLMEIEEKKNKNKAYKPILDSIPEWPVYQLTKNRKEFIEEVANKAIERIRRLRPTRKQLLDELEATIYREQNRLKRNRWRVDPSDEPKFFSNLKNELLHIKSKSAEESAGKEDELLYRLVHRYANEI